MSTPEKSAIMANLLQQVLFASLAKQQFSYFATQASCLHFILDPLAWIRRANSSTDDMGPIYTAETDHAPGTNIHGRSSVYNTGKQTDHPS